MGKFFFRFFLFLLVISASLMIYLSYFGIETSRFDNLIKEKANEVHKHVKLDFKNTKIHISPAELNLVVRLQKPKILIKNNEINLSNLDLFLPLKSFFTSDFILKKSEIGFKKNDIKDLTKITNIFLPRIINKRLKKIFAKGNIEGEFIIPFTADGKIQKDYAFSGKVYEAYINLPKDFLIKDLTAKINYRGGVKNEGFNAIIEKGTLFDIRLDNSNIAIKNFKSNEFKISSLLYTNGNINSSLVNKLLILFNINNNFFSNITGNAKLNTNINFDLSKKFKIKNLSYITEGNIVSLELDTKKRKTIEKYLPKHNPKIRIKDTKIRFKKFDSSRDVEMDGLIKVGGSYDRFKFNEQHNFIKKNSNIVGTIDLTNSEVTIPKLNYMKEPGKESELSFVVNFILNKEYNIENLNFSSDKTKIYLSNIKLNKNFETTDFKKLKIKTFSNQIKNNDFEVNKSKNTIVSGEVFDAEPLLKSLYKKVDKKTFSKNFNSEIKVNFTKALTGTKDTVSDFAMVAKVNKGSYDKLSMKGNFLNEEIIEMSIYKTENDKKTLHIISDRAAPFIKDFDFIKGFEGGKLEYESIISREGSNSNLIISDFKVSKVPALAKLLTLASLQGIADTLSGEGIRFDSFEMKSTSKGNLLNIDEALALGPAVSILLNGYVEKGKTVSLKGTLIPATKLNSIIASIPLVGDILVGKKTGEGVVGVSFKMKGPPKDIKTTVNPIKTITPRFIVRAMEKMKKKKKEEAK